MILKVSPRANGRKALSIIESYRRPEDGRTTTRTVMSLGYLDELERQFPDPIAHFREVARRMSEQKRRANASVALEIRPTRPIDMNAANRKNVGCAVPLAIYNSLGIERTLRNHTARTRAGYDPNAVMRLLVVERLLDPGSKRSAVAGKDAYFFRSSFTEDDVYRALDVFADARDKVVSCMNRHIEKRYGRDTRNVFYDVTNYYFEADPDDLRARGVSKERRPNPIVQMGLLQDADGVPITYRLFPGNTVDGATMLPVLADMKRDLDLPTVTAVADKGLNCSANMAALVASGDGFVFSQSVRGTKSDGRLRARVLDGRGYRANAEGTLKRKSWQGTKTIHLRAEDTHSGKAEDVEIEVKYVALWSRKYAERARAERARVVEKARELVAHPGSYSRATHFGAARYVKGVGVDRATGELVETEEVRSLDLAAIERDAEADGYFLIVSSRTSWSDDEIVGAYRGLWQIEESFRVTKSDIEARPVYVRTPAHIEAHFLTCYIALTILRLIQKVSETRPSAAAITDSLRKLSCSALEGNWWLFDHRSELTKELFSAVGIDHPTKYMTTRAVRSLMQKKPAG